MHIDDELENFTRPELHTSRPGSIKRQAAFYLGMRLGQPLTRYELKQVNAKAHKIKDSKKKADRHLSHQLVRYVD